MGFALETTNDIEHARRKTHGERSGPHCGEQSDRGRRGFGSDTNVVTLITPDGRADRLPRQSKFDVANVILDRIVPMLRSS